MKCPRCGSVIDEGALFCRDCGNKIIHMKKRFCRDCGSELKDGAKYCENCGAKINLIELQPDYDSQSIQPNRNQGTIANAQVNDDFGKGNMISEGSFSKVTTRIGNTGKPKKASPILILLVLLVLILFMFSHLRYRKTDNKLDEPVNNQTSQQGLSEATISQGSSGDEGKNTNLTTDYSLEKGTEYAFMSDEWNVYIAKAVSDSIIKIEHWDKLMATTKEMSYSEDIGTYKINDTENGFSWIDDQQTAFTFIFQDKNNSKVKKPSSHVFTINISDEAESKGTDFNKNIKCYSYKNDDWHLYRAIPLTDNILKIECWSRSLSTGEFLFGWDWCVIDPNNSTMDFEWTDDDHTSFTITAEDSQNDYYWKEPTFVLFELENEKCKYNSVKDYLDGINSDDN